MDWPGAAYWEQLVHAYPAAKVVLTVRDPYGWYDSTERTIGRYERLAASRSPEALLYRTTRLLLPPLKRQHRMVEKVVYRNVFGGRLSEREEAVAIFRRHNGEVLHGVPAGRLLVYEVGEGGEKLCAFLGVEQPDEPFPRLNDRGVFSKVLVRAVARSLAPGVLKASGAAVAVLFAAWTLRHVARFPGAR